MATIATGGHVDQVDGKAPSWLAQVFEFDPDGLHWARGVWLLDMALVPMVVLVATGHNQYVFAAVYAVLRAAYHDPGGAFGSRVGELALYGLVGCALTALAFSLATTAWGWRVLAVTVVTLVGGLMAAFGEHRFAGARLLNLWFLVALSLGAADARNQVTSHTWAQVLAWAGGTMLYISFAVFGWLIHGRTDREKPVTELPSDDARRSLTTPLVMFAVLRALAMAIASAIAYGANLPHADWLPIACLFALQPSLEQTTVRGGQRLIGALAGATAAAALLFVGDHEQGLRQASFDDVLVVLTVVFLLHSQATRFWNFAVYTACGAAAALISIDVGTLANYSAEGERVLWTFVGVGIAALVMLLGTVLSHRGAGAHPQPA